MAIGKIKTVAVEDGQIILTVETGTGQAITATLVPPPNLDVRPFPGDTARFSRNGQEYIVTAVFTEDSEAGAGEARLFSRSEDGTIAAVVWMKADGSIEILPGDGQSAIVGAGSDFVAMASKVLSTWSSLDTALLAFVPPFPDGGAALAALIQSITATATDFASTNLKAD